jgi:hypothetical protein
MEHIRWFLAVVVLCIVTGMVSAVPVVQVEPEHIEVSQGDVFRVNITVDPAGFEIMGAQYTLYFDNVLLNAVDQSKGAFLSHDGASAMNIADKINNTAGRIEYGEMRIGVEYGVNTSGMLATITFNAAGHGVCGLILDNVTLTYLSDSGVAQKISDVLINNGTCDIKIAEQTPTPTATEPPSIATTIPTTVAATSETPTATATATAVQTGTADQTPTLPEPHLTATQTPTTPHLMEENTEQSGFSTAFVTVGLLILLYAILRKKVN